jgi:7,8-dihydropterin-6-yl-methyl-4-(beta-D-ribofuranosyl)aminobenzene 5'-phosphate synthase
MPLYERARKLPEYWKKGHAPAVSRGEEMEIITLVENSCADTRLREEFGLSLLVKCRSGRVLFDMGASARFAVNAAILDEDLAAVDCAVLSHAHYDHGGGLATFLEKNSRAPIYAGKGVQGTYYAHAGARAPLLLEPFLSPVTKRSTLFCRYIGLDSAVLVQAGQRLVEVQGFQEILPDVYLLTDIGQTWPSPPGNRFLLEQQKDGLHEDPFRHELIMVIREDEGLVLFTGCGHRGVQNMVDTVQRHFAGEKIKAVIGGFHLARRPGKPGIAGKREDIAAIAGLFNDAGVDRVLTGHCTGDEACTILAEELGDKFSRLATGLRYTF